MRSLDIKLVLENGQANGDCDRSLNRCSYDVGVDQ